MPASAKVNDTANPFGASIDETAERIRALNEKVLVAAKQTGKISLDAYEKTLTSLVEFEEKVADASQLDWVSALAKAHASFLTEVSSAYTSAAREAMK